MVSELHKLCVCFVRLLLYCDQMGGACGTYGGQNK